MAQQSYTESSVEDVILSQEDVARLLEDPTSETKIDVLHKVSRSYQPESLSDNERTLAEQIFRLLVKDSAVKIRASLADNLKDNPYIPKDIILDLARDVEEVASPVLTMSEVLDDDDIVDIIEHSGEIWRYLSVSKREIVSEKVSGVLLDSKNQEVVGALLDNKGAAFSDESLHSLADMAEQNSEIAEKLSARPALPTSIVEKLISVVSDDVADYLQREYQIDQEQIASQAHHAREQSTLELITLRNDLSETERLVRQLNESDRLSASLIINALCHGNTDFFEASLAVLADVSLQNARMLIADKGKLGFRAIYNKSGLPSTMFKAVRLLLHSVRDVTQEGVKPGSRGFANYVVSHMLVQAEQEPIENLSYILALLRQHSRPAA